MCVTLEKSAQREVHILDEGSRIPSAGRVDARFAPHAACAVEVEEIARGEARVLLALDVSVEANLLRRVRSAAARKLSAPR